MELRIRSLLGPAAARGRGDLRNLMIAEAGSSAAVLRRDASQTLILLAGIEMMVKLSVIGGCWGFTSQCFWGLLVNPANRADDFCSRRGECDRPNSAWEGWPLG